MCSQRSSGVSANVDSVYIRQVIQPSKAQRHRVVKSVEVMDAVVFCGSSSLCGLYARCYSLGDGSWTTEHERDLRLSRIEPRCRCLVTRECVCLVSQLDITLDSFQLTMMT